MILAHVGSHVGKVEQPADSFESGANAAKVAIGGLDGKSPELTLVFASSKYNQQEMLNGVTSIIQSGIVAGASTAGEISQNGPETDHSVVVMCIASDTASFFTGFSDGIKDNAHKAGRDAAEALKKSAGGAAISLVITLNDALAGNGSEVIRGAQEVFGPHFPIVGGSAGDDASYKQTFQYLNGKVSSGSVVLIGVTGTFKYGIGVNHGWIPMGVPMKVTKSEGAVLHELNGKPAFKIFEEYLGSEASQKLKNKVLAEIALSYPLGLKMEGSDEMLLRAPFFVNDAGSITCGGEMPEGSEVRLMIGNKEEAVVAARKAAEHVREDLGGKAEAILIFSCHVRDKLFGNRKVGKEETDAIKGILGAEVPFAGLYTYAEQAPLGGESRNIEKCNPALHNETVVILALGS